jgi:hypothetical protein
VNASNAQGSPHTLAKVGGVGAGIVLVLMMGLGRGARGCNRHMAQEKKNIEASLPAVGSRGALHHAGPMKLCPQSKYSWGWPCGSRGTAVAEASRVQIMKTGVFQMEGLCRYWVQGPTSGPDVAGDAPCAWYRAD